MVKRSEIDNIIVTGKSGAGKQPRIDVLVKEFGLVQLSTGNIFREFMGAFDSSGFKEDLKAFYDEKKDDLVPERKMRKMLEKALPEVKDLKPVMLGLKAKYFVNAGKFVPDSITNELFSEYFSKGRYRGFVLDGYPRTKEQTDFLLDLCMKNGTRIDLVMVVDNEDGPIIERTMGRRICPSCKKVYHIRSKPSKDGVHCDVCGAVLVQRSDDTEERIRTRLAEFYDKVLPALSVLEEKGIPVVHVEGNLKVFTDENVRASVMEKVGPFIE